MTGIHDSRHATRRNSSNSVVEDVHVRVVSLNVTRMVLGQPTATKHVTMRVGLATKGAAGRPHHAWRKAWQYRASRVYGILKYKKRSKACHFELVGHVE